MQEVKAAGEPEGLDLFEEVLDGDGGVLGPALAQVLAVGVDEAGTVLGDAEHPLGPVGSRVAFDGVQGQLQAAGALEQAVDLVPAFQGRLRAGRSDVEGAGDAFVFHRLVALPGDGVDVQVP